MASKSVLALLFLFSVTCFAQEEGAAAQVRRLEEKWAVAYKEHQFELLSNLLTEDFVITVEDGSTFSKAGYISHSADPTITIQTAEFPELHVRVRSGGMIAVATGTYHEVGRQNGKRYEYNDRFTDVWVKVGPTWRILCSHYSVPVK